MAKQVVVQNDHKYQSTVWRSDREETFQEIEQERTDYGITGGYIARQTESKWEFFNKPAASTPTPQSPPPYFFGDATFRANPAYTKQLTEVKTTSYESQGGNSIAVTVEEYDPVTGTTSGGTNVIFGTLPAAITRNSVFSRLVQRPISGTMIDGCIDAHFVPGRTALNLEWAEDEDDIARATRRQMQRDSAVVRRLRCAANPLMRVGQIIMLIDLGRSIRAKHVLVAKKTTRNWETGDATAQLTLEFWPR